MTNINIKVILFGLFSLVLLTLSSCVSTEIIEPEPDAVENNEIVLNLSAPSDAKTRADKGYYLRYVAKLFPVINGSDRLQGEMVRAEIIESDDSEDNKIVFKVEPGKRYQIMVFADYIPSKEKDENNNYQDYFYNTSATDGSITLNHPAGSSSSTNTLTADFFNNDNYDCFSYCSDVFTKYQEKKEIQCVLERAVAKVQLKDNSNYPGTLKDITFTTLKIFQEFRQPTNMAVGAKSFLNKSFEASELKPTENGTVFYFYTFASKKSNASPFYINLGFTTSIEENSTPLIISEQTIQVAKNYITTVSGTLLTQVQSSAPDDPTLDDEKNIVLDLSTSQDWANDLSVEVK